MTATDHLSAPPALVDAYEHIARALSQLEVHTWREFIPDLCCDEHADDEYDVVHEAEPSHFVPALSWAFIHLAEEHTDTPPLPGPPAGALADEGAGRDADQDEDDSRSVLDDVLYFALRYPDDTGARPATTGHARELLAWAHSAPITSAELLARTRDSLGALLDEVGVRCSPDEATVTLHVERHKRVYLRPLNDAELDTLTTLR